MLNFIKDLLDTFWSNHILWVLLGPFLKDLLPTLDFENKLHGSFMGKLYISLT